MMRIARHPNGPRVYMLGQRVHHGAFGVGVGLCGVLFRRRALVAMGVALAAHDAKDFPWRDHNNH